MESPFKDRKVLILAIIVAIVVIMLLWVALGYNDLVAKEQDVNSASSNIKVKYTNKVTILRELLPQLENYSSYEIKILTNLTALQTQWQNAVLNSGSDETLINISTAIDANILALSTMTTYPNLQFANLVSQFMGETVDLNEQLSFQRGQYNDAVRSYNSAIKSFPMMMFSGAFGFNERPYWGSELPGDGANL